MDYAAHARLAAVNRSRPQSLGVVYLAWAPLGIEPVRAFLRSYRAHRAGIAHELIVLLNGAAEEGAPSARGAGGALTRERLGAELVEIPHRLLTLERPVLDLPAYGQAARALTHGRLCFLNSHSTILAADWLAILARAHDDPNTGLVGATASWESQAQPIRGRARYWPYQLARLRRARQDFPGFPNPHVRTTAFMLDRALALALSLEQAQDKHATYLLESGRRSLTRQVLERALRAVIAGRDGRVYGIKDWAASRTYRSGGQDNLLVADRRTEDWRRASPRLRRRLSRDAWGEHYVPDGPIGPD
jgi:hypothetical protein